MLHDERRRRRHQREELHRVRVRRVIVRARGEDEPAEIGFNGALLIASRNHAIAEARFQAEANHSISFTKLGVVRDVSCLTVGSAVFSVLLRILRRASRSARTNLSARALLPYFITAIWLVSIIAVALQIKYGA